MKEIVSNITGAELVLSGNILTITVDVSKSAGSSKTGKNELVCTSHGWHTLIGNLSGNITIGKPVSVEKEIDEDDYQEYYEWRQRKLRK